jgi:hypothetical protein
MGIHIQARTWLHRDQLSPKQEGRIIVPDIDNAPNDYFTPEPLRHLIGGEDGRLHVAIWHSVSDDNRYWVTRQ